MHGPHLRHLVTHQVCASDMQLGTTRTSNDIIIIQGNSTLIAMLSLLEVLVDIFIPSAQPLVSQSLQDPEETFCVDMARTASARCCHLSDCVL